MTKREIIKLVTLEINRLREVAKTRQPIPRSSQETRLFRKWNKGAKRKYYLFPILFDF